MNQYKKVSDSKEPKDRAVGWCLWRIYCQKCPVCGKTNVSYTLYGTEADAKRFASDPDQDCCDKCA